MKKLVSTLLLAAFLVSFGAVYFLVPKAQAACNAGACNRACKKAGFDGGVCVGGSCLCFIVTP